ncbi:MAG: MFS transporter [candidate division WWE3 bacterium]|nr:MFS transporter [candidate division WWE3 bacterium]
MPTITPKKFFRKVVAIQFLTAASGAIVSVVFTLMLRKYLGSDKGVSLAIAGFNAAALFFFFITVPLVRYLHQRRSLDIALLLMPFVIFLLGFATNIYELCFLYTIWVLFSVIYSFNVEIYMKRLNAEENIIENNSKMGAIYNSAWVIFPFVGSFISERFNYSWVFVVAAAFAAIAYLILPRHGMPRAPVSAGLQNPLKTVKLFFSNRFRVHAFINALGLDFIYGSWFLITLFLNKLGASATQIGIVTMIVYLPWVLLEIPVGRLADRRIKAPIMFIIGYVIMAITTVIMGLTTNIVLFTAIYFLCACGSTLIEQIRYPYFLKHLSAEENGLVSIFLMESPIGRILAPLLVFLLLKFLPIQGVLIVFGLITLIFAGNALFLREKKGINLVKNL